MTRQQRNDWRNLGSFFVSWTIAITVMVMCIALGPMGWVCLIMLWLGGE